MTNYTAHDDSDEVRSSMLARIISMSPEERLERSLKLSAMVKQLVLAGIRERTPNISEEQLRQQFAAITWGVEICKKLLRTETGQ